MSSLRLRVTPVAEPQRSVTASGVWRATARPQQLPLSHFLTSLTRSIRFNGLPVAGNWCPTESGKHQSSITVTVTTWAVWKVSTCFLKRLWFIDADLLITRTNILVRYLKATKRPRRPRFNSKQGARLSVSILPIGSNQLPIQGENQNSETRTQWNLHYHHSGPRSGMCGTLPPCYSHILAVTRYHNTRCGMWLLSSLRTVFLCQ